VVPFTVTGSLFDFTFTGAGLILLDFGFHYVLTVHTVFGCHGFSGFSPHTFTVVVPFTFTHVLYVSVCSRLALVGLFSVADSVQVVCVCTHSRLHYVTYHVGRLRWCPHAVVYFHTFYYIHFTHSWLFGLFHTQWFGWLLVTYTVVTTAVGSVQLYHTVWFYVHVYMDTFIFWFWFTFWFFCTRLFGSRLCFCGSTVAHVVAVPLVCTFTHVLVVATAFTFTVVHVPGSWFTHTLVLTTVRSPRSHLCGYGGSRFYGYGYTRLGSDVVPVGYTRGSDCGSLPQLVRLHVGLLYTHSLVGLRYTLYRLFHGCVHGSHGWLHTLR